MIGSLCDRISLVEILHKANTPKTIIVFGLTEHLIDLLLWKVMLDLFATTSVHHSVVGSLFKILSLIKPGAVERVDHHYDRDGRHELFMTAEPLAGWRHVEVSDDWIGCMQRIADEHYPDAECIRMVLDNLSTHKPEAVYDFLPPDEARESLALRVLFHTDPRQLAEHGGDRVERAHNGVS